MSQNESWNIAVPNDSSREVKTMSNQILSDFAYNEPWLGVVSTIVSPFLC